MYSRITDIEYRDDIVLPKLNNVHGVERLQNLKMGLWGAFLDTLIRNEFKKFLVAKSDSVYLAMTQFDAMVRYIDLKKKTVFNSRLKSCEDVSAFADCLLEMFDTYNTYYSSIYAKSPYLMFEFLDFILDKEYDMASAGEACADSQGADESSSSKIRKGIKFSIIFPDGKEILKTPSIALAQFIDYAGVENVASKNAKLINLPFVSKKPMKEDLRYYKELKNGWYMVTGGDSMSKFRLMAFLNESLNLGLKLKMI